MKIAELLNERSTQDKILATVTDFYRRNTKLSKPSDFESQSAELLDKADQVGMRDKVAELLHKAGKNPYVQGGVITTIGSLLAGGILTSAAHFHLTPGQTNIALQAILNTVIPTLVSRINGKDWVDTIKYTLASAAIGTAIAALGEDEMSPDQWRELRRVDPKTYLGTKDYKTQQWWDAMYRMHETKAREQGAKHFEFPPGSNMWFTVTKGSIWEASDGPPHGTPENELAMMKAGTKPAVLMADHIYHELYEPIMDQYPWVIKKWRLPHEDFIFYTIGQAGEDARVKRIGQLILQANSRPGGHTHAYHRELGRLLGYSEADIEDFLQDLEHTD